MFKQTKIGLFLATSIGIIVINSCYSHPIAIASNHSVKHPVDLLQINQEPIVAKKSGGRSGGGSFKSRPSRSKSSSPRRNSNPRKSTSPSRNYQNNNSTYRDRDRDYRRNSPTYNNSTRGSGRSSGMTLSIVIIVILVLLIFFGGFFAIAWLVFKLSRSNSTTSSREERQIIKERDNDRVTISLLQVALSSDASDIQQDLTELSTTVDTDTESGLVKLMQESALILLRRDTYWTHVRSSSESLNISQAESAFDRISVTERSKFSRETLSNIDGEITTRQARNSDSDGFPAYVVVTLICGTADDRPLFENIYSEDNLREALLKLSSMREDYLMKFELLWTPQVTGQYLTDEELLMEYTDIMQLQ